MPGRGRRGAGPSSGRRRSARRTHRRRRRRRTILVGGMVAYGVHKISKKDSEKIEQHTGKDWEDMSDEEIDAACKALGIEKQPQTEEDKKVSQQQEESGGEVESGASTTNSGSDDYMEELEKLSELKDKGILTEDEFNAKKKELLGI